MEPRRRCEQAIVAVVMEAYVNGVSTRKVDRLVEQLGIAGIDKDRVSRLCRNLDEHVEEFRSRPLEGAYPYLWLDAKHVKVRDRSRVVSKALVIAYAVSADGVREVIGLDLGEVESEAFWLEFLRSLRARGLDGVQLVISDYHEGLKTAITRDAVSALAALHRALRQEHARPLPPRPARPYLRRAARGLYATNADEARRRVTDVIARIEPIAPKVAALLEQADEDLLAFYAFPAEHCPSCAARMKVSRAAGHRQRRLVALACGVGVVDPRAKRRIWG